MIVYFHCFLEKKKNTSVQIASARQSLFHNQFDESLYSPDVLNGLKISGLPNHKLILKVGVLVMLLRNIDQKNGLCNGTRLQVVSLGNRIIETVVLTGSNIGHRVFISRLSLTPSDNKIHTSSKGDNFP